MVDAEDREKVAESTEQCAMMQRELMNQAKADGENMGPMVM
jgi:hypothetical protein